MNTADLEASQSDENSSGNFNLLVSQERSQKFDLLLHLINNLTVPLVVSGPEGIGKSTFLKHLVTQAQKGWEVCYLSVTFDIDLDAIQKVLLETAGDSSQFQSEAETATALAKKLSEFSENNQLLVLILDNAGSLEPGLLKTILDFVEAKPMMRLVFALRPDNLHIKASTDDGIESCHFIEIPPLTEQDTEKYLHMMPPVGISKNAVNPELVAKVYRQSHGIPGLINSVSAKTATTGKPQRKTLLLPVVFGAAVLIAIVLSYFLWKSEINADADRSVANVIQENPAENDEEKVLQTRPLSAKDEEVIERTTAAKQKGNVLDGSLTSLTSSAMEPDGTSAQARETVAAPLNPISGGEPKPARKISDVTPVKIEKAYSKSSKTTKNTANVKLNDENWLLDQSPQHFVLQLMASTDMADLHDFVAQYPRLNQFAYYRVRRNKTEWYKLLYGNYPSLMAAKSATLELPSRFRKAWPRRLKTVRKEIRVAKK